MRRNERSINYRREISGDWIVVSSEKEKKSCGSSKEFYQSARITLQISSRYRFNRGINTRRGSVPASSTAQRDAIIGKERGE